MKEPGRDYYLIRELNTDTMWFIPGNFSKVQNDSAAVRVTLQFLNVCFVKGPAWSAFNYRWLLQLILES